MSRTRGGRKRASPPITELIGRHRFCWAFAWRTLIAAELVFGTTSGQGGLGWFIFEAKNQLEIPDVFARLLTIILIGLFVENVIFRLIERMTVQRWGMQN